LRVLIYQDYLHNTGILLAALKREFGNDRVAYCDAADIVRGCLDQSVTLFVMPGGADLYYCEKLNGAGNQAIRSYVAQGGTYLGICAGAYYGCRRIEWAKNRADQALASDRELGFFSGTATGPIDSMMKNQSAPFGVAFLTTRHGPMTALYTGGPFFVPDEEEKENIRILAEYDLPGKPIAIFETGIDCGLAIFCGPHIESTPEYIEKTIYHHNNKSLQSQEYSAQVFSNGWDNSRNVWSLVMSRLKNREPRHAGA
jgi:glutamine amidotransferase-like uncharacterized protein